MEDKKAFISIQQVEGGVSPASCYLRVLRITLPLGLTNLPGLCLDLHPRQVAPSESGLAPIPYLLKGSAACGGFLDKEQGSNDYAPNSEHRLVSLLSQRKPMPFLAVVRKARRQKLFPVLEVTNVIQERPPLAPS